MMTACLMVRGSNMIDYKRGNLLLEDAEAMVNAVNCVGVMGGGIALQFKKAYPDNFDAYAAACGRGELQPGRMFVFDMGGIVNPRYIVNFPTKRHWRDASLMADIDSGLEALVNEVRERDIRSMALPALGCGLGGLEWVEVKRRIEKAFVDLDDVHVMVFEPVQVPGAEKEPEVSSGRASEVE